MADPRELLLEDLQKQLNTLRDRVSVLEETNHTLSTAIAMIAEMWRRMDKELQTGEAPDRSRVGRFSFVLDSETPHHIPVKLVISRLDDRCLRLDFIESGDNDRERN